MPSPLHVQSAKIPVVRNFDVDALRLAGRLYVGTMQESISDLPSGPFVEIGAFMNGWVLLQIAP